MKPHHCADNQGRGCEGCRRLSAAVLRDAAPLIVIGMAIAVLLKVLA